MFTSRVRVRQPCSLAGLLLLCGLGAQLWAIGASCAVLIALWLFPTSLALVDGGTSLLALAGLLYFLIWMPGVCQRHAWAFLAGCLAGAVYVATYTLAWEIGSMGFAPWSVSDWIDNLTRLEVAGILTGTLTVISVLLNRLFLFSLVSQDGSLCNHCAYPVGRSASTMCPECGKTRNIRMIVPCGGTVAARLDNRANVATVALVLVILGLALWQKTLDHSFTLFRAQFPADSWQWVWPEQGDRPRMVESAARTTGHEDMMLIVELTRSAPFARAHMRIRIGSLESRRAIDGDPRIICDIPRSAVRDILHSGVPPTLQQRLVQAAVDNKWEQHGPSSSKHRTVQVKFE